MVRSIIVAKAYNEVIGYKQQLPWHLPNDLNYFKQLTLGHHVILGRKTFESLPKSLPGRTLIIITHNLHYKAPGCKITCSLQEALTIAEKAGETEVFIAGGGSLYQEALAIADQVYLTEIKATIAGDTFFPRLALTEWQEVSRIYHAPDNKHAYAYDFVKLIRKCAPPYDRI